MYGRKHIDRVAAVLTAVAALALFAGPVQAANSRPVGMTKAEYRALMLRSEALNAKYGLGGARVASTPRAATVAENGFVWDDFAIGAAGMLGLLLVATGVFAATRRIPRTRVSS